jgi:hypothetical protein
MNIWTNYWTKAQHVVTEHLDQYTQLSSSEKQDVHVKTFAVAAGVGLLGACFSPKIAPIIGSMAGLATFAYLTQKKEKAAVPSSLPTEIRKPPHIQVTLRNSGPMFHTFIQVGTLPSYQDYYQRNRVLFPIAGIGLSPFLYPHDFRPQDALLHSSTSNSHEEPFTIGPSTKETPIESPSDKTSTPSESSPDKASAPSDMEFELNVYKMENNSLKEQVKELEQKLEQSRAVSQPPKNEEVLEEDTLLTKESLQQVQQQWKADKDRFASAQQQWEIERDELEQTVEKQKIQIAHLNFQLQALKRQSTNDLAKQQSTDPALARKPIKSSIPPSHRQLHEVKEQLQNLDEAYQELAGDYYKIQQKNKQLTKALAEKTEQEEKNKALIKSYENDLNSLLSEREKLRAKLLKIKRKEELVREGKLREARQQIASQAQELLQLQRELKNLKEEYYYLIHHRLLPNGFQSEALELTID